MGPTLPISKEIFAAKYLGKGEVFEDYVNRAAGTLCDGEEHRRKLKEIFGEQRFLPAGRIQAGVGSPKVVTLYNCFVSRTIDDSMEGIMEALKESAQTMRMGGGIGYDFSTLRPRGNNISSLDSPSSGPISFMDIFDTTCGTIASYGHRRGAQMGVMRVDHPDIEEFVQAKTNSNRLTRFNVSVAFTDDFMNHLESGEPFQLQFDGQKYGKVDPNALWDKIMRNNYDWAEPGALFIDTINRVNNLRYCETISATNPCGEQPLPPYGACLLGSFNLVKYFDPETDFNFEKFKHDITHVVRAMDNVVDRSIYPLEQQKQEAFNKRRMGLGITGFANLITMCGLLYGSNLTNNFLKTILDVLNETAYMTSVELAIEKGSFPYLDRDKFLEEGTFASGLPENLKEDIMRSGIRNSHLTSIAPTGTISLAADNISSGIEPVFQHAYERKINSWDGQRTEIVTDYAFREHDIKGETTDQVTPDEHVDTLIAAANKVDSAVSKTCNVPKDITWENFKDVYLKAYIGGVKGITTYRKGCKREGILTEIPEQKEPEACYYDPETGSKSCD